ncbi:MAG: DUF1833 family protein [Neisseriaceae bacterium]|nr:DUF1833 family protein [Neisseriaceae bacterium]
MMSEALKEAYASAPVQGLIYNCIEINHDAFSVPIRLVQGMDDIKARLEAGAPRNAGQLVNFVGAPWDMVLPSVDDGRLPELQLTFDNISREITEHLALASTSGKPISVILRVYTESTLGIGPQIDPPIEMELGNATANNYTVTVAASLEDVFNSTFPLERYTHERFPSLSHGA